MLKYKVGDELYVKGKIAQVDDNDSIPYKFEFINGDYIWLSESQLDSIVLKSPAQRRKEIEEQIQTLTEEMESLK